VSDLAGLSAIVRLPDERESGIVKALDSGAAGVQIPALQNAQQVREAARHSRHHPHGLRGLARVNRSAGYGSMPLETYLDMASKVLVAVHVESKAMALQVPELCTIDGLDVIFVGAADLGQSLGLTGQDEHPIVRETVEQIISETVDGGKIAGAVAGSVRDVEHLLEQGVRYIAWKSDVAIIRNALMETSKALERFR
jgi:4-hydroxy-2-oxoheptanedioate aldolase